MIYLERIFYDFVDGRRDMHLHEADFVLNYICAGYNQSRRFIETRNLYDIRNYSPETFGNNIFVFDYRNHSLTNIVTLVKAISPKVIIMLSDEGNHAATQAWNDTLSLHCKLFIREYRHITHTHTNNTMYMPYGFSNHHLLTSELGEFNPNWYNVHHSKKLPSTERKIHWSFSGNFTREKNANVPADTLHRREIIDIMQHLPRGFWGTTRSGTENIDIYKDSVFVISMRGWCAAPTSRPYEAMMTGAIPVVVCTPEEREINFYGQSDAPWVWATDWVSAREECRRLLDNPDELLRKQSDLQVWWNNYLQTFRDAIKIAMESND